MQRGVVLSGRDHAGKGLPALENEELVGRQDGTGEAHLPFWGKEEAL